MFFVSLLADDLKFFKVSELLWLDNEQMHEKNPNIERYTWVWSCPSSKSWNFPAIFGI
jgi:hypothetical protein